MNTAEHIAGEPAISVIVPIYNVEPYLGECLDSLCGQTLRNIEIIGVDDGSTDGSGALLDEYAAKDKRIIAVHQKNAGVSAARNAGMRLARGEYLAFVDGDDWMDADFLQKLYTMAQEYGADIAAGGIMLYEDGKKNTPLVKYDKIQSACWENDVFALMNVPWHCYVWNKIYRREMLLENNIFFSEGKYFEDMYWTPLALFSATKVVSVPDVWLFYRQNFSSITHITGGNKKKEGDFKDAKRFLADFLLQHGIIPVKKEEKITQYRMFGKTVLRVTEGKKNKRIYLFGVKIFEVKYWQDEWVQRCQPHHG